MCTMYVTLRTTKMKKTKNILYTIRILKDCIAYKN